MQVVEVTGLSVRSAVISMCRRETPLKFALFPVFRVASPAFSRQIRARLRECDLIVAEGVEDRAPSLAGPGVPYRLAPRLRRNGLAAQDVSTLLPDGVAVVRPEPTGGRAEPGPQKPPWRDHAALVLAAPLVGLAFAARRPRAHFIQRCFDQHLEVDDMPPVHQAERRAAAYAPAGAGGQRDGPLLTALERIHREHAREPLTVAVVFGAQRIPQIARDLNERLGYRPREAEWLTVVVLA